MGIGETDLLLFGETDRLLFPGEPARLFFLEGLGLVEPGGRFEAPAPPKESPALAP